jgi:hypothetical protein
MADQLICGGVVLLSGRICLGLDLVLRITTGLRIGVNLTAFKHLG